jgi:mevalonate kinase
MQQQQTWYAHGKLLITGEYLVMEGARALAMPVSKGQYMQVGYLNEETGGRLRWMARKPDGLWFRAEYAIPSLEILKTTDKKLAEKLARILSVARELSPHFLEGKQSFDVETRLEFDTEYGFGSSSTLIANLAAWAGINAFSLQWKALGGSGYDVACAGVEMPVFYQIINEEAVVDMLDWNPLFKDRIYFVYLGKKQRSDESVRKFKEQAVFGEEEIRKISDIGEALVEAASLELFESLLRDHEKIMSDVLGIAPVGDRLFKNHKGVVKSLGAWGGDFVLVTSHKTEAVFRKQMKQRGFDTVFSWNELTLKR